MTPETRPAYVELTVPGLDHDRNLELMVSKQDRFSRSAVVSGRSLHPGYKREKRNSLSLLDDPDVARISAAIESTIMARLTTILEKLEAPPFRVGDTSSSCVCFRNGSYFRSHVDVLKHRAGERRLTWVYYLNSEPRRFSGGDLLLGSPGMDRAVLEPAHGRIVVFSSSIAHEVTTVRLDPDDFGDARFTITGFISDQPTGAARLKFALRSLSARVRRRLRPRFARRSRGG
jgi:Rps23 Pro-64 3,4-dihydroxylase Tpa1-like proline 4-hydroxylase